jgi:hypothetical protein
LLEEVRALHTRPADGDADDGKGGKKDDPAAAAPASKSLLDLDELASVVDQIQVGDKETGAKALQGILEKIASAAQSQAVPDVDAVVDRRLASQRRTIEVTEALTAFKDVYPDVANDAVLGTTAQMLVQRELVKDLTDAGFSEADLKPILSKPTDVAVRELSARQFQLRESGVKMRSYKEIMSSVGSTLTEKYGFKPKPAAGVRQQPGSGKSQLRQEPTATRLPVDPSQQQARIDAKRQQTTQQPRAAGVRGAITPPVKKKSNVDVVRDIIKQRGFQPTR